MPALTSLAWSQLGAPRTGQNHNGIYDGVTEPFSVGGQPGGAGQLVGTVYDMAFYANGVLASHPRFDVRATGVGVFRDMQGRIWSVGGGAIIH